MITHQGLSAGVISLDLKALIVALYSSALFSNIQELSSLLNFYTFIVVSRRPDHKVACGKHAVSRNKGAIVVLYPSQHKWMFNALCTGLCQER